MTHSTDDYIDLLLLLQPRGVIWTRDPGSVRARSAAGLANEMSLVETFLEQILAERSPRTAYYLLGDWEKVLGLPDECTSAEVETIAERRAVAHARMISTGGQSPAYYIAMAKALGYDITILEYRARWYGRRNFGEFYGGQDMQFVWRVVEKSGSSRWRKYGSAFLGEKYRRWGNYTLLCMIRRTAPAHTIVLFS